MVSQWDPWQGGGRESVAGHTFYSVELTRVFVAVLQQQAAASFLRLLANRFCSSRVCAAREETARSRARAQVLAVTPHLCREPVVNKSC